MSAREHVETADLLDAAADVIERDGWCQGDYYPGHESLSWNGGGEGLPKCARGALYTAQGVQRAEFWGSRQQLHERSLVVLAEQIDPDMIWWRIPTWNDAQGRTRQEVLDTFRLAAKSERRKADAIDGGAA